MGTLKKAKRSQIDVLKSKKDEAKKASLLKSVKLPTKTEFKAWLKKMDYRVVGRCQKATACAMAQFLESKYKGIHARVDYYIVLAGTKVKVTKKSYACHDHLENIEWRIFPVLEDGWLLNFLGVFDSIKGCGRPVTGREALAAWEGKTKLV